MTNPIVSVRISTQIAPTPSALQKTGALISQGATSTAQGALTFLSSLSALTALLNGALTISTITWNANVATVTTAAPHGFTVGDSLRLTVAGCTPSGYNGNFFCNVTSATQFTYNLNVNPGALSVPGTYTEEDVSELLAMATTFFAQGGGQGVYVLECGAGSATDGANFLTTWIAANPGFFYAYLVPRYWDGNATFLTLIASFEATASKTYFFVTTTLATYKNYTGVMKDVLAMIEAPAYGTWAANVLTALSAGSASSGAITATASTTTAHGVLPGQWFQLTGNLPAAYNGWFQALPGTAGSTIYFGLPSNPGAETALGTLIASQYTSAGVLSTEFSLAAVFQTTLNYAPSSTNRVTPLNLAYLSGVTPFPTQGNAGLLSTLNTANINVVGTGAQGGISNTLLIGGNMMDGNPFNYWYSVDWVQVNGQLDVTAACIAGSNNPQNPLYYNQPGINALQGVLSGTMSSGIGDGLVLNPIKQTQLSAANFAAALEAGTYDGYTVVNADPFASYTSENPSDYSEGVYNGLAVDYTPLRGFASITIFITASNFA